MKESNTAKVRSVVSNISISERDFPHRDTMHVRDTKKKDKNKKSRACIHQAGKGFDEKYPHNAEHYKRCGFPCKKLPNFRKVLQSLHDVRLSEEGACIDIGCSHKFNALTPVPSLQTRDTFD